MTPESSDDRRPLRSVLYMPAANERALEKAKSIPCDAVILDLEDAVAPDAKDQARTQAVAAAASGQYGHRRLTIRSNGLDTPWGADDIAAVAVSGATAVVVPKVSGPDQLEEISDRLDRAGAPAALRIWPMIETPQAVFAAREIAGFSRAEALVVGTNDLARELGAASVPGRHPLVPHLATIVLAAREAHTVVLDGVFNDISDGEGFLAE